MITLKRVIYVLLLFVFAWTNTLLSQSDTGSKKQLWIDINPAYYINPHLKLYGDIGMRREFDNNGWWRLVVRPSLRIWLGDIFYYTSGIGNFVTFNENIQDRYEFRPFQGVQFKWPNWKIPISHYFRLEERFDFNTSTWLAKASIRIRYKLNFSYRWAARLQADRFWQVTAGGEAFWTLSGDQGQFQEQMRITLGIDRSLKRDLHMRFELTWQLESLIFASDQSVSNIYFRYRLFKSWGNQK